MTTETQATATATANVTFEDVRAALGDLNPNSTNASALRKALGRGSQSTIQRHLDTLRSALAVEPLDALGAAPDVPKEVVQALWSAAWTAAQARTAGALAAAQARTEQLAAALAIAQADTASAQAEADEAAQVLAAEQAKSIQQNDQHIGALDAMQREVQGYVQQVEALRAELAAQAQQHAAQVQAQAQAQALADARAAAIEATLRGELDRHVSQLADLRAALSSTSAKNAEPEPAPAPVQSSII